MAITDYKLTESDFASTGAEALPDKVVGQAEYVKGMIDGPSKDVIMPKYNAALDAISDAITLKTATFPAQENIEFTNSLIRRMGGIVFVNYAVRYAGDSDSITNGAAVGNIPAGFRPGSTVVVNAMAMKADRATLYLIDLQIGTNGSVTVMFPVGTYKCRWIKGSFWFPAA